MPRFLNQLLMITALHLTALGAWASDLEPTQAITTLRPRLTSTPPVLDGTLDDLAWNAGPVVDDVFITYNPVDGDVLPQSTKVYLAYDQENLYFAFHCRDSEPDRIKTSVTKHDNLWRDDWVGFSLDTVNGKQYAYDLFVNPSGMQGDIYRSGNGEDSSPDWVWYTGASVVDDGYVVEVRLPLKNFRFRSGENVEMGVLFWRRISRLGLSGAWPEIGLDKGVFNSMARVVYGRLDEQLKLEVLPSVTSGSLWDRQDPAGWSSAERATDIGLGIKYGITSDMSTELTVNPDFSQVESDTFQVVANQRYPNFYSEKRPFFMESGHQFNIAGTGGDSNMRTAVHTRRIVDPRWGGKLTGETARTSFSFLASSDTWAGRPWEDDDEEGPNPHLGQNATFMIGRARYSLSGDSYVGALYTGRELPGDFNRVAGADFRLRLHGKHNLKGNYLHSLSRDVESSASAGSDAFTLMYEHFDKPLGIFAQFEEVGEDFRMDTAFFDQEGIRRVTGYVGPQFYPQSERFSWMKRINPFLFAYRTRDHVTGLDDTLAVLAVRFDMTRQGQFRVDYIWHREHWQGQRFDQGIARVQGGVQLTRWLNLRASLRSGDSIYYDEDDPFLGRGLATNFEMTLQPNDKLSQYFDYTYEYLDEAASGEREYDLHVLVSRTTYQFNKHVFLRALLQYDSYRELVLSDVLASLTVVPGTVFHVGYGTLHERARWLENEWVGDDPLGRYEPMRRSFFIKGSYLVQF
jgi:hypothetical protein